MSQLGSSGAGALESTAPESPNSFAASRTTSGLVAVSHDALPGTTATAPTAPVSTWFAAAPASLDSCPAEATLPLLPALGAATCPLAHAAADTSDASTTIVHARPRAMPRPGRPLHPLIVPARCHTLPPGRDPHALRDSTR